MSDRFGIVPPALRAVGRTVQTVGKAVGQVASQAAGRKRGRTGKTKMYSNETQSSELIALSRAVDAILVPYGETIPLPEGTKVQITQALGDTFTVMTDQGFMARIAGKDADALGREPPPPPQTGPVDTTVTKEELEEQVWEQLRTCYDPEIPVNIAELGLIYGCDITPHPEGGHRVDIRMTLTAPGCGMGDILASEVDYKLRALPGVRDAHVELVFEPPWDLSMMPESARLALGMF